MSRILIMTIITFVLFKETAPRKKFKTLLFQNIQTDFNAKYIRNYSISASEDQDTLNMNAEFIKATAVDIWLQMGVFFKDPTTAKLRRIFTYDLNVCSLLGKDVNKFSVVYMWVNNILKYSNLPRSCPVKEGTYNFWDFRLDKDSIPAFISTGTYRISSSLYFRDLDAELLTNTSMLLVLKMK